MTETTKMIKAIANDSKVRIDRIVANYEQLEKENADLQKSYEELYNSMRVIKDQRNVLEKENVELKDYRLTTLAKQQTENQKYTVNLEHKLSWYDDQLTKAKEIIHKVCYEYGIYDKDLMEEAKQFLKEE